MPDNSISIREMEDRPIVARHSKKDAKRKSSPDVSWYDMHVRLDPWSYEAVLKRQLKIGAKSPQAAIRYTLRRLRD